MNLEERPNAVVLPRRAESPARTRAAHIDLDDLDDVRSLAILSVTPASKVLDVGCGGGSVARALAARGCRVWAIDVDSAAVRQAEPWCESILLGDIETADLATLVGFERADSILILDVLEHLRHPAAAIRRLVPFLAPGGQVTLSLPRSASHPDFCDRSLSDVLLESGLRVVDTAHVVRRGGGNETALHLVSLATTDGTTPATREGAERVVVFAVPGAASQAVDRVPTLASRLHRVESERRRLQRRVADLEREAEAYRLESERIRETLEEAREWHRQAAEEAVALREKVRHSELDRVDAKVRLGAKTSELERCQLEQRFLRDDLLVKDAYLATLREEAEAHQRAQADMRVLATRLDSLEGLLAAECGRSAMLAASNRETEAELDRVREELRRTHAAVAATLSQPRYVLADRCNRLARRARFLHTAVKRAWAAWHRAR